MRRIRLFVLALALAVPTAAQAGTSSLDPNGQSLTMALEPWFDSLLQLFLTRLGI